MTATPDSSPRDDAIRLLARREYGRQELRQRLAAKGHEPDQVEACLDELEEQGLQSDQRFAESFLRSRVARGQGPVKVRAELGQRGIDDATQAQAFDEVADEVDWYELAAAVLARRFSGPGDSPRERARRERFLAGRGFDFDQLRHAMTHAWDTP
ncbi:recombination regulator RecX [Halomonas sp. 18H]|uniref:regulatory protein RecX n=1 Tax=Halomonas almeriensis TaxID=308163 RepID=UPI002231472C|nr:MULTISPECIES: regulatory protein RecX [Halomonas]MCW4149682.1 recombination regulator RecX [Halomonas sp. 18H]MDN3553373.1 regulatory protein RecX [Halomonas almeriensis]